VDGVFVVTDVVVVHILVAVTDDVGVTV